MAPSITVKICKKCTGLTQEMLRESIPSAKVKEGCIKKCVKKHRDLKGRAYGIVDGSFVVFDKKKEFLSHAQAAVHGELAPTKHREEKKTMEFFDCHISYGMSTLARELRPLHTLAQVELEMDRAGVAQAVVSRVEQTEGSLVEANALLTQDISGSSRFFGVWAILPSHTREMRAPEEMVSIMKENRIAGWRLCPGNGRYLPKVFVLQDWLKTAQKRSIPLFVSTAHGTALEALADILEAYPELTAILHYDSVWPSDRLLRPFVVSYPNVYLDMTDWITDGAIESFVQAYGPTRLLYGSGMPNSYLGSNMLMIQHADISREDKALIASGNMKRILKEARL